jgi:asparagine synthase (glutamine-hydrolysing)
MCGIVGYLTKPDDINHEVCNSMNNTMSHRGPDNQGIWLDESAGIALGHRRLSILDLSSSGNQPMVSKSGRYVITYNGELYNYNNIYEELKNIGLNINSNSDTRVLIEAINIWGIESTLNKVVGMFAFALWDKKQRILTLARDRMGEKPLYYGWQGNSFLFGSELKSFKAHPHFGNKINRQSIQLFLKNNCIPAPFTIYSDIKKLLPGHFLQVQYSKNSKAKDYTLTSYWSIYQKLYEGIDSPYTGNTHSAIDKLEDLLIQSIKQQMISDVPLGAFLSGGIDSTLIVSMMQSLSNKPINTYTIGFNDDVYNEAKQAKIIADHIGTDHTELYITEREALDVIPRLSFIYDEPFSDSSQIPTYLVSLLAKKSVSVSLSGDSGDELFGGYSRYTLANKIWSIIKFFPPIISNAVVLLLSSFEPKTYDRYYNYFSRLGILGNNINYKGDKVHKLSSIINSRSKHEFYDKFMSNWKLSENIVKGLDNSNSGIIYNRNSELIDISDFKTYMMSKDLTSYLPDDILVKVDRAAMNVSLETRIPMLDYRIVEFSTKLPMNMKIRNGISKWILRQVLYKYVPKALVEKPKKGFSVPVGLWLRGPLKEWAENLINKTRLENEGYLNTELITKKWEEHQSGERNWHQPLWDILMFQSWLEKNQ